MGSKFKSERRRFLKNASLASLGLGLIKPTLDPSKQDNSALLACEKTTLDYYGEGPFYTDNPPSISNNKLASDQEPGDRMIISGRVFNLDCSQYIPDTIIDIWHADHDGAYDNIGYKLRGITKTNSQGFYLFETIKPGKYLNGSKYRPSHIHFKITPPNFPVLTTQLYFEGDSDIPGDASASINTGQYDASHRIIPLNSGTNNQLEGTWDIVVDGIGISGMQNIHIDKGMIYDISPNPFSNEVCIKYGVFKKAKVSLHVYDLSGREVATLAEEILSPEKYEVFWDPEKYIAPGHYFVALKVNDLQVHYMKLVKD